MNNIIEIDSTPPLAPAELLGMSKQEFTEYARQRLPQQVRRTGSGLMHPDVITRSRDCAVETLWVAENSLERKAGDPNVTAESYKATENYRNKARRVLALIEDHPNFPARQRPDARHWRSVLNDVADAIEGTALDRLLDEIDATDGLTLRDWLGVRRAKDPSRTQAKGVAA